MLWKKIWQWKEKSIFQYKFVLNIDGTVAAYRFPFLLAGNSVIFKSFSDYYEHFYIDLEEGLHYFHFTDSSLIQQIKWAEKQDHNKTLNAMRQFVLQYLQPLNIYCYYADFVQYQLRYSRPVMSLVHLLRHHGKLKNFNPFRNAFVAQPELN